jgi:hypothetical protein
VNCDRNTNYVPTILEKYEIYQPLQNTSDTSTTQSNDWSMDIFRYDSARATFISKSV